MNKSNQSIYYPSSEQLTGQLIDYRIVETVYSGSRTIVYRAVRICDQKPVVIKLLKNDYPSFSELVQFRNQYTIAKNLDSLLIIQAYSLDLCQNGYALVMEDFGGTSLKDYFSNSQGFTCLKEFLILAITLCDILDLLYQERIIHKDIKPANILINPETKQVKLIDFSIASLLPRETQEIKNANALEGTLAYISPEQTGRMNRGIDYRTDFYSLGITFYELLTGELPFQASDPMELIHAHIAKLAPLVHEINSNIPLVLSAIVMKLMAKNAEDRYQSALGLKFDLQKCLTQLQETGEMPGFVIGERDVSDRFIIPDKLYGRETEVETLLKAFDRVSAGATEMMLVAGFSGIGKTAVVNEVHKPIVRQRGYFIKGKFDQFQKNIPFSAFVQAFRDLMGQLLTESEVQIQQWQDQILEVVGENGQVIIEVIPELANIIGEQPAAIELSGTAAENRFNLLFQKFTQVFTSAEHPLVIFLDDLQWADSASLKLIQLLMVDTHYLLLIGAYRDNEVSPVHPLMLTLGEVQKKSVTINRIDLAPLNQGQLNQLVADTLRCSKDLAENLSQLVYQKTQGNPFFASQFLKALSEENLIQFNAGRGCWLYDVVEVRQVAVTDDVVEFMALQLAKLSPATQSILKLAVCVGNQFDLATLAMVSGQSEVEAAINLWEALKEGLILPIDDVYKLYQGESSEKLTSRNDYATKQSAQYKFLHDRVQQAAYSLIPDEQKQQLHYQIGQLLLQKISPAAREDRIFEIVHQLNHGTTLITQKTEKEELAQLNLVACRKAKAATAYQAAREYATIGLSLLEKQSWQQQYKISLTLHELAADMASLCGDFEVMEKLINLVTEQAHSLLEKINVYRIKIQSYVFQNKPVEALAIGLKLLQQLGVTFPESPAPESIQESVQEITELIGDREIADLADLPVMIDPQALAIIQIASNLIPPAYNTGSILCPLLIALTVKLSIHHGNAAASAFNYANYGFILCNILQEVDIGTEFGQLSLQLISKFDAKATKSEVLLVLGSFVLHRKSCIKNILPLLQEGYGTSLEVGNVQFAGYYARTFCNTSFWYSQPLVVLEQNARAYYHELRQLNQVELANHCRIAWQSALNLLGVGEHPCILSGEAVQETEIISQLISNNDISELSTFHLCKLILYFLFGEIEQAYRHSLECSRYFIAAKGLVYEPTFYFYDSLIAIAALDFQLGEVSSIWQRVDENQIQLQQNWANYAPMNYQHKADLVAAEKCRVLGQKAEAVELYDKAIAGAKTNKYIQEQALANELTAKFYLSWGKLRIAQEYMTEAYYAYAHWGAKAKVTDLETRYSQLLAPILSKARHPHPNDETLALGTFTSSSAETAISSSNNFSVALDLASILKASQALSSEIQLDKLLATVLEVVIASAGADKCVLILERDEQLVIKGTITVNTEPVVLQKIPIEDSTEIPLKLIYKVKRNQQTIVLVEATTEPTLATDPYIINQQPKSILCSPILHQGKLIGILYLENNLTLGAFTSERVELLNVLCTQAAISIENATLYQKAQQALLDLQQAQLQIVQSEKMSALGNLVAGVAHEINNPIGFIAGNLNEANRGLQDLIDYVHLYQEKFPEPGIEVMEKAEEIDLDYLIEDLPNMLGSMKTGCDRIKFISKSLRTFSRSDTDKKQIFDIHEGIDSTVMILRHRLKANEQHPAINVVTNYGNLPPIKCFPGQLNQVFMNILANAIDAFEESNYGRSFAEIQANPNKITITTKVVDYHVQISIMDNGNGMTEEIKAKIFDHLFTTKEVGKGTGLGLAIARQIIEETHQGTIEVNSKLGQGTEFIITF